jgi:AcrR family transcriptional regulator
MTSTKKHIQQAALRLFAEKGSSQITVSELAQVAGIARGTIYNNIDHPDALFESVATQLVNEMHERIVASYRDVPDPALRLAYGIRFFIKRGHEDPIWGRFVSRFAYSEESLQGLWKGAPMSDVLMGISLRRFNFRPEQVPAVIAMMAGTVLTSIFMVLEGHRNWQEAGSDAAELVLRAVGIPAMDAYSLATLPLPELSSPD